LLYARSEYAKKVFVFTRRNGQETLLALNAATGKLVWQM
jgi:hypothetical protein